MCRYLAELGKRLSLAIIPTVAVGSWSRDGHHHVPLKNTTGHLSQVHGTHVYSLVPNEGKDH